MLELLFVECDVVVLCNVLKGIKKIILHVFLTLLLLDDDCSLEVQVIFFFEDVEKRWIGTSIDSNLLELVPEMVFNCLLFESVPC